MEKKIDSERRHSNFLITLVTYTKLTTRSHFLPKTTPKVKNQRILTAQKGDDKQRKTHFTVKPIPSSLHSESKI